MCQAVAQSSFQQLVYDSLFTECINGLLGVDTHCPQCVKAGVVPIDEPTTALGQGESDGEPASGPMICGKRGTTYQPSRRKRINSHGLEKR